MQITNRHSQAGYGIANVMLVVLLLAVLVLEFGFDIFERMGGNLLKWNNTSRTQEGRAWEQSTAASTAQEQLGKIVSTQDEIRRELNSVSEFTALPEQLKESKLLTVSRARFLDLYSKIPEVFARRMGSPMMMMELASGSGWRRTAFFGKNDGLDVYYIDEDNRTLSYYFLDKSFFSGLKRWGTRLRGKMEDNPDFSGRIYSGAGFMNALAQMQEFSTEFYPGQELLKQGADLEKVGVSRRWENGMVEMAFQFTDGRTVLYPVGDNFASKIMELTPAYSYEIGEVEP